ncbi:MAG TPA: ABC transporter permease, partial [Gemmatimonadales bacterium]|nr:ABC transporter permease [Gemmatimonadales bacterium]
ANTAIFTVIDTVLLRPLPYANPDRLVGVWEANRDRGSERNSVSPANYLDWTKSATVFEGQAATSDASLALTGGGEPEQVKAQGATAGFFPLLGLTPLLGRTYSAEEEAAGAHVVVLSEGLWRERYGADRGIIGRSVRLDGVAHTVIGVMPAVGDLVYRRASPRLWVPLGLDPVTHARGQAGRYLQTVARLNPGVTVEAAQAEMATIAARLAESHPEFNAGWTVNVVPLAEQVTGGVRRPLGILGGVVLVVLLIACANVANLQLAQATARRREIAVRTALGASRARVVRQFLVESVLLAGAGGALGVLLALWGTALLGAASGATIPRVSEVAIDARVLGLTLLVSVLVGLVFGLVPALQTERDVGHDDLKDGTRGSSSRGDRSRALLVGAQVALSLVLLVGAGLLIKSFARLQNVDLGFDPEGVMTARVALGGEQYADEARQIGFFRDLVARVDAMPGVTNAGLINWLPLSGSRSATDLTIEGLPIPAPGQEPGANIGAVDPGYFAAMRIPLVRGRVHTDADDEAAPKTVVVSQSFVDRYLPDGDPLGRRIAMGWGDTLHATIVGVVGDVRHSGIDSVASPTVYWSYRQFAWPFMTVVARTDGDPRALAGPLRDAVRAVDPSQPVADVRTMDEYLGYAVARRRFTLQLLAGFAGLALTLTAIGLYGTTAYGVAQRTRELGIRIALGASDGVVLWGELRRALAVILVGVGTGIAAALALGRVLASQLYEVSSTDPLVFAAIAVGLASVGALASYLPARRATRVDPMVAIRAD